MNPADLGGRLLGAASSGLSAVRTAAKPLHPSGDVYGGRLVRRGADVRSGVAWLDGSGTDQVLVRLSRGGGLPRWLPDVHGLALRAPLDADRGFTDVLMAGTGWNRLGRYVLVPGWRSDRPLCTLMPYRGPRGPVLLGARPAPEPDTYRLYWAPGLGAWHEFADLHLDPRPDPDAVLSFDPLLNPPPGLGHYRWTTRLREPAYASARGSRDSDAPEGR